MQTRKETFFLDNLQLQVTIFKIGNRISNHEYIKIWQLNYKHQLKSSTEATP